MPSICLIPIDEELRQVIEESPHAFSAKYGASLGEYGEVVLGVVSQTLDHLEKVPREAAWGGFLAADPARGLIVGACGYAHGPDRDGSVEISYFTFPRFEASGYATQMASELLRRGLDSPIVTNVIAHTLPERNASSHILEKIGLTRDGEAQDEEAGVVWRWSYRASS